MSHEIKSFCKGKSWSRMGNEVSLLKAQYLNLRCQGIKLVPECKSILN